MVRRRSSNNVEVAPLLGRPVDTLPVVAVWLPSRPKSGALFECGCWSIGGALARASAPVGFETLAHAMLAKDKPCAMCKVEARLVGWGGAYCRACRLKKSAENRRTAGHRTWRRVYNKALHAANPLHVMVMAAKQRAKKKGLEFNLDKSLLVIPPVCPVLGIKLEPGGKKVKDGAPSLDRMDHTKGYTHDNVRVISWRANMLKRDATVAELEAVLAYMKGG